MSSKSPRLRVSTPEISGRVPTSPSIASARSVEQLLERGADRAVAQQPDPERPVSLRHARVRSS